MVKILSVHLQFNADNRDILMFLEKAEGTFLEVVNTS